MPTGYTHLVEEGKMTELSDFVFYCARAFGAFIHQRDDGMSVQNMLPPLDTSYHENSIKRHREELDSFTLLSTEARKALWQQEYENQLESRERHTQKQHEHNARHVAMLEKVKAWNTDDDHANLKNFMIQQLEISIDRYSYDPPKQMPFEKWQVDYINEAARALQYHEEQLQRDIKRHNENVKWITDLYKQFGKSVPGT